MNKHYINAHCGKDCRYLRRPPPAAALPPSRHRTASVGLSTADKRVPMASPRLRTQTLCCLASEDLPTCQWRGFHSSGKCKGGCESNEAEVGTIAARCPLVYQSAC
ncbi:hypothetical protein BDV35DRAFT_22650 [Aspergillus flavus]|uniref:Uncharacterized protein n=1 Tax=Aspergillus flavus TaxID=5059 RepID=A0A5N6H966_ASPFL|nr:hypothetical protein BDV35DRAFT_22650 [Aspergillus flavus]